MGIFEIEAEKEKKFGKRNNKFSFFNGPISNTIPSKEVTVEDTYKDIISGKYKDAVSKIRSIKHKDKAELKKLRNSIKRTLDYITPACVCTQRDSKHVTQQSGCMPIDVDELGDKLKEVKEKLRKDPYVCLLFESPSGEGLKAIVKIPKDKDNYERYVGSFYDYLVEEYNLPAKSLDRATKDVVRACFLSHDEDAHYNPSSKAWAKKRQSSFSGNQHTAVPELIPEDQKGDARDQVREIKTEVEKLLDKIPSDDYDVWTRVLAGLKHFGNSKGIDLFDLADKWSSKSDKYDGTASVKTKWDSFNRKGTNSRDTATIGSVIEEGLKYGWQSNTNVFQNLSNPIQPNNTLSNPIQPNNTQREFYIKAMLSKERPETKQIKSGIQNGIFYFGTVLYNEDRPVVAVITSDKQLHIKWDKKNEIKEVFGLNYRYDFEYQVLDNHFSVQGINKYLYQEEAVSVKECYEALLNNNKEYMYYPNDIIHSLVALDIICTYTLPCFEAMGRTFIEAEKGSGKTRQCTLYKLQCCNSIMSADISKSSFFRIMESTCQTLIIDDFDNINEDQKNDILQHYKTGYKNSSKSIRTGDNKKRSIDAFRTYGHVAMNNTSGIDSISADRSKYLPILKSDGQFTKKLLNEADPKWKEISDKLYISALQNWKEIKTKYDSCESNVLSGRMFEVTRPILTIASMFSNKLKEDLESFFRQQFEENQVVDYETDWDYLALKAFVNKEDGFTKSISDITEDIAATSLDDNSFDYKRRKRGIAIYLGKMFKKIPVFKTKHIHGKPNIELLSKEKFEKYLLTKGWLGTIGCDRVEKGGIGNGYGVENYLLKYIATKSEKQPIKYEDIYNHMKWDESHLDQELQALENRGDIFSPKPGLYKSM